MKGIVYLERKALCSIVMQRIVGMRKWVVVYSRSNSNGNGRHIESNKGPDLALVIEISLTWL